MKKWLTKIFTAIIAVLIIAASVTPVAIQYDDDIYSKLITQSDKTAKLYERLSSAYYTDEQKEVYLNAK